MSRRYVHTCLRVRDPEASVRFYGALGFEPRGRLNFSTAYNIYMGLPGGGDVLELTVNVGQEEPYRGHAGMREYFADVERTWEDLTLFATDFRAIPGAVIVMGHVEGRIGGEPVKRRSVWTWKVADGKATEVKAADLGNAP